MFIEFFVAYFAAPVNQYLLKIISLITYIYITITSVLH